MRLSVRCIRAGLAACIIATGIVGSPWGIPHAAAVNACRGDPIVILSNGIVLDLSVAIATAVTNVKAITYVLHAPIGVSVLRVLSTDGTVGYRERFKFKSDSRINGMAGVYTVEVQVKTRAKGVGVMVTISGGNARTLGITPEMVSATTFTPVDRNDAHAHGSKGPKAPSVLPPTVTASLAAWARSAAWAVTASSAGQDTVVSISL